jgi:beta-mannosidase
VHVALNCGWTVRAVGGDIPAGLEDTAVPATVPGCVHLDLMAAGLIPDPYLDGNEATVAWVGRVDWRYETTFDWAADPDGPIDQVNQVDLVALGLDTVATVWLNGELVASTQNMHRSYRLPVGPRLRSGRNELAVVFAAGVPAAERMSQELGPRPHINVHPFNAIRKMAANFGWDWGPDLVTAGIWRPLSLESWAGARIASVRPLTEVDGTVGRLRAHLEVQRAPGADGPLAVEVQLGGQRVPATLAARQTSMVVDASVADAELWWPHGYGDQRLYPVEVTLSGPAGRLDAWRGRVGFRTVELDTAADEHGTPFAFRVNGVPVFARGVNWIPDDVFLPRIDAGRYAARLRQARDANVNLVRVWGGGIYESDEFYDTCDELGLLVWQDFLFACAAYAEEEPLREEVIAEAREAVTRLSPHPSLVLWNGCNENIWGHEDWDWKTPLGHRSWGWGYYTQVLPGIVAELDPARLYSPGSPYSMSTAWHPNDPAHGTMHIWDVWNERDYTAYRDYVPRFCAEFGFQGPPAWATLTRAVHDQPLTPTSPGLLVHQKAEDGNGKLVRGLRSHLPEPGSMEDWHWATSLNQARAIAFGVEHFRSWAPVCAGAVVWQLNDCWPVTSWAAIDGDGRRKPMWYALRRSYRDRLLTLQPRDGGLALVAVNDSGQRWKSVVEVSRRSVDGSVLATTTAVLDLEVRAAATIVLPSAVSTPTHPDGELLLAQTGGERAWWHFAEDVDSALPAAELDTRAETVEGGYRVRVTARTLVRDLALLADQVDPAAVVDDMLVTLLPGDTAVFEVRAPAGLDPATFTDPAVLRSANQLLEAVPVSRSLSARAG